MVRLRDGAELWTTASGTGPPLACLHGGPGLWDYLAPLAALLDDMFTVVRFDQRGCGRSTGGGPFTIAQAVDDLDQVRAALGFARWAVAGHSWGAELALRYAAQHQDRTTAVAYVAGVGDGNGFRDAYAAERDRLGPDRERLAALSAIPASDRTPDEEREQCLLQWRPDFSPASEPAEHALALWNTRPPGAAVNVAANRELWADRGTENLCQAADRVTCPVTMLFGADDPRPWTASDSLLAALPNASRIVFERAGHAPWAERPTDTRQVIIDAIYRPRGEGDLAGRGAREVVAAPSAGHAVAAPPVVADVDQCAGIVVDQAVPEGAVHDPVEVDPHRPGVGLGRHVNPAGGPG
jgi:proline iminopeptidase